VGGMTTSFESFNLLPAWYHDRVVIRRETRVWAVVLGIVVPTTAVGVLLTQVLLVRPAERLADEVRAAEVELAERRAGVHAAPVVVQAAEPADPRETRPSEWADLLRLLASMTDGEIGFDQVEVHVGERHVVELSLAGLAEDSQSVLRFAATVERSGLFAPMNSPSITYDDATGAVRFELSARIVAVATAGEVTE